MPLIHSGYVGLKPTLLGDDLYYPAGDTESLMLIWFVVLCYIGYTEPYGIIKRVSSAYPPVCAIRLCKRHV